ncbi:MAG: hypothetical protein PF482_18920 [Desulfobacteraceae bacterium]|nr:hypothetical protein [Desulfobacteraceae bacterium]
MFESIKSLLPPSVPRHTKEKQKALRRKAASVTSSGNVLVQYGHFVTQEEFDILKEEVLHTCK